MKEKREMMMAKTFLGIVGGIAVFLIVVFSLNLFGYENYAFFAPRYEGVRRDVMIQSRAYSEATTREMYRLKLQYQQAQTPDERATIRAMALHEAESFDRDRLPPDLQLFLVQLGEP